LDKVTRRIFTELANTFLEEALDLAPSEKGNLNAQLVRRELAIKFPEVVPSQSSLEIQQRRNTEIDKEGML
jgi:hypothetical protein